ncbi:hypothetical protein SPRG_12418 [Saprolegnia parasitica CBS 223.65]|uniref:Tudor domain-containing protein n=1 Tax=Saprolegnia parasitica (strain CBS 223.65) TaxID=695850 RepID=A0A067C4D3_SAPPC|nr:hypothetical protein SPRG_12418 [Saprolegnia parasitica CBS 223.65]KDO21411.1 hypothetical protein SPRG_12418 [Saprolegnia parasitica CBS 223.65]|eukprot:XP_012207858.1 hypothetical protein SPRG_12418 [Saprolegnia parasitica CBS 223.65]
MKWAATLVLVVLGYLVYKYVLKAPSVAAVPAAKKKAKKKSGKKKKAATSDSAPAATPSEKEDSTPEAPSANPTATTKTSDDDEVLDSSSDDEDGLSAAQILAQKHFGAAAMCGAQRMAPASKPTFQFEEGQRVLAQFQNQREWFNGTITKVQRGNLYTVQYDDGEIESKVPMERIRLTNGEAPWSENDGVSSSESGDAKGDDEWEVVKAPAKVKGQRPPPPASAEEATTGLTKKQRESRRRKERLREQKELLRSEAQEGGLHARWGGTKNKWTAPTK